MKYPLVSAVVASAALVQVGASPIKLDLQGGSFRFGHALGAPTIQERSTIHVTTFVPANGNGGATTRVKMHCKGMKARLQQKTLELSNAFRQALGLPIIETNIQILPIGPPSFVSLKPIPDAHESAMPNFKYRHRPAIPAPEVVNPYIHHSPPIVPNPDEYTHRQFRPHPDFEKSGTVCLEYHKMENGGTLGVGCKRVSFLRRIHTALTTLGPWEGRVVAFVLGCGIGVLLRMFWVLALVSYRAIKGSDSDSTKEYTEIIFVEEAEEEVSSRPQTPAPAYTDEKVEVKN